MRYVFLSSDSVVVNTIVGVLNDEQIAAFLHDYAILFGADRVVTVADDSIAIYSGGRYDVAAGFFSPPPPPQPEIIEGTSEEMTITEGTPDGIAVLE
jgi:hypothetical protein